MMHSFNFGKIKESEVTGKKGKHISVLKMLFVFVSMLALPVHMANAVWYKPWTWTLRGVGEEILEAILFGFNLIVYNLGNFALNIAGQLVHFGAWLVDLMMDQGIYKAVLVDSTAIKIGWETIRDFCNMFFIFFLLIVAFATVLRISEYSAKVILPKFLIAIFMINFSMEITKLVIDFGQVFMYEIRGWMGDFSGTTGGGSSLTSIVDYFNEYFNASATNITADSAIAILFAAAYSFMLGFTYIMMAGFLLIRLLMFAVLMILSPFAFFANIFPGTRHYSSDWWRSIMKYSLFGPIFIFFVFISATMAFELTNNYNPAAVVPAGYAQIEAVKGLIPKLIPNVIALMMLWMAIPITQKLGIAGSSRLIGGTLGLGTVAMASYGATKLAGGWGKKAVEAPASRLHAYGMGQNGRYKAAVDKLSGGLKKLPLGTGRIFIQYEADKAVQKKEDVAKHQKIMENLSDKDKKSYVDSFSIDRKAKADAQQAMFNLLAKDSGKGLTDARLQKMGYEKEVNGQQVFDKKKFESDYNRAKAYGHDTGTLETYRPDMLTKDDDIREKVKKVVQDGNYKNIKSDALANETVAKELEGLIGKKKYDEFINNKSQEEKSSLSKHKEKKLAVEYATLSPADLQKKQVEIASLASPDDKVEAMKQMTGVVNGQIQYAPNINNRPVVNLDVVNEVMDSMSKDQFLDLNKDFFEEYGHMVSDANIDHIAKFGDTEQLKSMKEAIVRAQAGTNNFYRGNQLVDAQKLTDRLNKINSKI
jgi:hypothetical protein